MEAMGSLYQSRSGEENGIRNKKKKKIQQKADKSKCIDIEECKRLSA